jgi:hypothetical protein
VNTKRVMIAVLLIGGLARWFFGGEDTPVPPAEPPPASTQKNTAIPRAPSIPEPRHEYGVARRLAPPTSYPDPARQPTPPGAWSERSYPADTYTDTRGYRFRPLTEGDRRRMGTPDAAPYGSLPPYGSAPPESAAPSGPWADGRYRSRPSTPGEASTGRYEPPYPVPSWGSEPDYAEQWDYPPWREPERSRQPDREPPARRMLPSLDWPSDRTFTSL